MKTIRDEIFTEMWIHHNILNELKVQQA